MRQRLKDATLLLATFIGSKCRVTCCSEGGRLKQFKKGIVKRERGRGGREMATVSDSDSASSA